MGISRESKRAERQRESEDMSESLAVLFRLGKALRSADSAEFCEQYDDRLLKQTGLSYITVTNISTPPVDIFHTWSAGCCR